MADWYGEAQYIAKRLSRNHPQIDRGMASVAADEAAMIYEGSREIRQAWRFESWVLSRIWQHHLAAKARKQEENTMAKITEEEKAKIRDRYISGGRVADIARASGVSEQLVYNICSDLKFERDQVIAALNASPKARDEAVPEASEVDSEETAEQDAAADIAVGEEVSEAAESSPVAGLYEITSGFASFVRENIPGDIKVSVLKTGDAITVCAENDDERVTLERFDRK